MLTYSVVVPVYNSSTSLVELCTRIRTAMIGLGTFEIVLVDDGSTDDSWKVLKTVKEKNPDTTRIVRLSKNFGQHNALTCGFMLSKGEFIVTMDDDLQHPPEEIHKLISKQK